MGGTALYVLCCAVLYCTMDGAPTQGRQVAADRREMIGAELSVVGPVEVE